MTHRREHDVPLRVRRVLAVTSGALGIVTLVGVLALWPRGEAVNRELRNIVGTPETYDARVLSLVEARCQGTLPEDEISCLSLNFRLLAGPDEGERAVISVTGESPLARIQPGTTIVVTRNPDAPPEVRYGFVDVQRAPILLALALVFAIAVVLLGRLRGVAALAGLIATFLLLLKFVLPAILAGHDPTVVAAFAAAAMAYVALYLAHGFGPMTSIALLGTVSSLLLTVALGAIFVGLADFSGFASEETFLVNLGVSDLDLSGLVLAGVIIGALGAIDDVTVTQASVVAELSSAGRAASIRELFRGGLRIGRDHVASTVNTLFLAYVGASLPLLLLFVLTDQSPLFIANREVVATEIVRSLVGSIGLVASVPLTTWLAAYCYGVRREPRRSPDVTVEEAREVGSPPLEGVADADHTPQDFYIPESRREAFRRGRRPR